MSTILFIFRLKGNEGNSPSHRVFHPAVCLLLKTRVKSVVLPPKFVYLVITVTNSRDCAECGPSL